ncbi:MAG: STAS domain-containing protein [Acidimicrobiales bacterium]
MTGAELDVTVRKLDGTAVVVVAGEIDVYTSPLLQERLVEVLRDGISSIVLDLSAVTFLDSTGLGVLITCLKRCRSAEGDLVLVTAQPNVLKVLEITGLNDVFQVHDSVDDAIAT